MESEVSVLNRQAMEVDHNCNRLSSELEVEKLQALVRSLEQQNQQLRSRQDRTLSPVEASSNQEYKRRKNNNNNSLLSGVLDFFRLDSSTSLDDVEVLDLEDMFSSRDSDDETWLYVSSRDRPCVDSPPLSPLAWCRHVLDSPRSQEAPWTPGPHLQQVSRWRPSISSPSPPSPPLLLRGVMGASPNGSSPRLAGQPCSTPLLCRRPASPLASPLLLPLRRSLSPLWTEPLLPPAERSPAFIPHPAGREGRQSLSPETFDDGERDAIAMGYKLHDLTDVQVMARLQEESLRQDLASAAPRRGRRRPLPSEGESSGLLTPPPHQPSTLPRRSALPRPRTFSSEREWHRSTGSLDTPPDTPPPSPVATRTPEPFFTSPLAWAGPGPGAAPRPGSDKLRRSMPNLVRPALANGTAPLPLLRAAAYVRPTAKGSVATPTAIPPPGRSGLPRLTAGSAPRARITQSPRSLATPPRSLTAAGRHASWSDGCY